MNRSAISSDHVDLPNPLTAQISRYRCPACGYVYDETQGCPHEGFAAGTPWKLIPDHWSCPDCAVRDKVDFVPVADAPAC